MNMLAAVVALALLQDPAEDLRKHVRAYAKDGGSAAKAEILTAGERAIRVVVEERGDPSGAPFEALTDLLLTLRFTSNRTARALAFRDHLSTRRVAVGGYGKLSALIGTLMTMDLKPGLRARHPYYIDPVACPSGGDEVIAAEAEKRQSRAYQELDRALAPLGLDWDYRYGVLFISTPARLWPALPLRPLGESDRERLRKLIAELDANEVERRAAAERDIPAFGAAAIPLLKAMDGSAEAKGRAAGLLKVIEPRHGPQAWTASAAMDGQTPAGRDRETADRVNDPAAQLSLAQYREDRLDALMGALSRASGVEVDCPALIADMKVTADTAYLTVRDALLLVTKTHGLDFYVRDGRVVVDAKANVEKALK